MECEIGVGLGRSMSSAQRCSAAQLAWLAHHPLIVGYVLGGVLIGPFTPRPTIADVHAFELFAEIGIVLLMFSIGVEFSLRNLLRVKLVAVEGGRL